MTREERIEQKKEKMQERVDTYGTEMYETFPRKLGAFILETTVFAVSQTVLCFIVRFIINLLRNIVFIDNILSISWIYLVMMFFVSISYGRLAAVIVQSLFNKTINQIKAYLASGIIFLLYGIIVIIWMFVCENTLTTDISIIVGGFIFLITYFAVGR